MPKREANFVTYKCESFLQLQTVSYVLCVMYLTYICHKSSCPFTSWIKQPPQPALKHGLIAEVARMTGMMHRWPHYDR